MLSDHNNPISEKEIAQIAKATKDYSCSDLTSLAREAALCPLRDVGHQNLKTTDLNEIRPMALEDFRTALPKVRPSVNMNLIAQYEQWNKQYGDIS